ncbi:threonine synthase [Gordonia sp. DT30]|uniref:threonine synthase n=1 Tax=unclassified Gordonia (in: high G+C Gram-positive bacteria) TaxID=2657482 RepID=UPI003CEABE49
MTTTYVGALRCPRCQRDYSEESAFTICPTCRDDDVSIFPKPVYDLSGRTSLPIDPAHPGIFRFSELLPVDDGAFVSLGEGNTPLLPIPEVGTQAGIESLYYKDESRNPTWSYKDRLAAVAITKAVQVGAETVVVSSTGNHGAAIAAFAARAGIRCIVLTLESVPQAMKTLMQSFGAQVFAMKQPQDRGLLMWQGVEQRGWVPMSGYPSPPSGSNPFGIDGYKTIAYELWEQTAGDLPDVIVAPVAYGDGIAGIVRGFADLIELGLADRIPRLIAAEPYGPLGVALRGGTGTERPPEPTVAFNIAAVTPTWQALNAIKVTSGSGLSATDEETMQAQAVLGTRSGIFAEASSAITLAVLEKARAAELVDPGERVVLLGTSTGLKDVPTTAARLPAVPTIEPTLDAFDRALDDREVRV